MGTIWWLPQPVILMSFKSSHSFQSCPARFCEEQSDLATNKRFQVCVESDGLLEDLDHFALRWLYRCWSVTFFTKKFNPGDGVEVTNKMNSWNLSTYTTLALSSSELPLSTWQRVDLSHELVTLCLVTASMFCLSNLSGRSKGSWDFLSATKRLL